MASLRAGEQRCLRWGSRRSLSSREDAARALRRRCGRRGVAEGTGRGRCDWPRPCALPHNPSHYHARGGVSRCAQGRPCSSPHLHISTASRSAEQRVVSSRERLVYQRALLATGGAGRGRLMPALPHAADAAGITSCSSSTTTTTATGTACPSFCTTLPPAAGGQALP